jgi:CheY-like chemotaxis protein
MHGGAIGFISQTGVRSTFSFYIKGCRSILLSQRGSESDSAADLSIRTLTEVLRNKSYSEKGRPHGSDANVLEKKVADTDLHILIVEVNLVNQRVLAKQLRMIGMHFTVANHGEEALEYLRSTNLCAKDGSGNSLSLILMDWEMPVMDGLTCVANIRQLQGQGIVNGHVPFIAVTANVRSEQVKTSLQAGMDDILSKPFRLPELRACMQKTLRDTALV